MNNIKIFSVYINEIMYKCFYSMNPNIWPYEHKGIDNREKNEGLPKIYNQIIEENLNQDCWLFFTHEDFDIRSTLEHIKNFNTNAVYGTFGVAMKDHFPIGYGLHTCSNKDGSNATNVGEKVNNLQLVESLDCQSILIHTSLFRKHQNLRFDENLTFDLYAEDFCMQSQFNYNIPIYVFDLEFQHYSHGKISERYFKGLDYLAQKFPNNVIPGSCSFIGGCSEELEKFFTYKSSNNS